MVDKKITRKCFICFVDRKKNISHMIRGIEKLNIHHAIGEKVNRDNFGETICTYLNMDDLLTAKLIPNHKWEFNVSPKYIERYDKNKIKVIWYGENPHGK